MRAAARLIVCLVALLGPALEPAAAQAPTNVPGTAIRYADQGADWTDPKRTLFYGIDQGSQLIPLAWLEALKQEDGKPFLDGSMSRYGFLPAADPAHAHNLPIGFTRMPWQGSTIVGISCAACHVRELTVDKTTWRIDGGPSNNDFLPFAADLDKAVTRVHDDEGTFQAFAKAVLGDKADPISVEVLRSEFGLWWIRFHTFIAKSLPTDRLWGPSRMDAISLIYNRLAGLDVGPPPTYLLPQNIEVGHAPVRYPFLWNAARQAITQWTGFAANGNKFFGLTRNLGEEYGVFGTFHPQATRASFSILNRNYLIDNSANLKGLVVAEDLTRSMGPPKWPWGVDAALAKRGEAIFNGPIEAGSGCATCHGIKEGISAQKVANTWQTPVIDVGTDRQAWRVIEREFDTGSMKGASLQGLVEPLGARDKVIALVRASVVGAIAEDWKASPQVEAQAAATPDPQARIRKLALDKLGLSAIKLETSVKNAVGLGSPPPPPLIVNAYEARVLQGIWAAAPYLHNGSVPSLTELLKPQRQRTKSFMLGPEYDPATLGLAANQPATRFTLHTTGCEDILSGDSNCGHEYGSTLAQGDKRALLEYLKTL